MQTKIFLKREKTEPDFLSLYLPFKKIPVQGHMLIPITEKELHTHVREKTQTCTYLPEYEPFITPLLPPRNDNLHWAKQKQSAASNAVPVDHNGILDEAGQPGCSFVM